MKRRASNGLSRRRFGVIAAGAGAVAPALAAQQIRGAATPGTRRPLAPETPPFDGALQFTRRPIAIRAEPFPMQQVRLLPKSVYADAQEWNRGYMSRLEADRLLYTFRANAGLPVGSAKPLGGWEQPENGERSSELRGHFPGHFLSATAQLAASGDKESKAKGDYMVAELAKCQQKLGGQYLSAFPPTWWDRLEKGERVWAPFYTIHKIMAGLFDMYRLAGNQQASADTRRNVGMGRRVDRATVRRTHAADPDHRVRRHRRNAIQPGRRNRQRPMGQGRRPFPEEELFESAGFPAR